MNRAMRRANNIEERPARYNLSIEQITNIVKKQIEDEIKVTKEKAMADGRTEALALMFMLPMEVLMNHYWQKGYAKKLPGFTEHLLDYYEKWIDGKLDLEQMKDHLWEYGGIRLEIEE